MYDALRDELVAAPYPAKAPIILVNRDGPAVAITVPRDVIVFTIAVVAVTVRRVADTNAKTPSFKVRALSPARRRRSSGHGADERERDHTFCNHCVRQQTVPHRLFLFTECERRVEKRIENTDQTRTPTLSAMGRAGLARLLANVSEQGLLPAAPAASPANACMSRLLSPN